MFSKLLYITSLLFIFGVQPAGFSGCIKEYSYERPAIDSLPEDTTANPVIFPHCPACNGQDDFLLSTWNFKYDTSFICGNITRAINSPDHSAFTFFGPSACSLDTGLIMTVYLNAPLIADTAGVAAQYVVFEYYNNKGTQDIFVSFKLVPFSLTIDTYTQATGIAKGRFSGYVDTDRHTTALIKDGKFEIQFN